MVVIFRRTKFSEELLSSLNERQKEAIEYLKGTEKITTREYANMFGISNRMARMDIKKMVDLKIFERKGRSDKTTYYVLNV